MMSLKTLTVIAIALASATALPSSASADISELFPVPNIISSWTTSSLSSNSVPLADTTFRLFDNIKALTHHYVTAPDGIHSMQAHYPKGSYNFQHSPQGGISFYAPGLANVDLTTAKEATFGYSVYFPAGFNFVLGGKLPGLYGGDTAGGAVSCSGGRKDVSCFSVRLMWRPNGQGELYTYLPPYTVPGFEPNQVQCSVPPHSDCNPTYGASVGRGAFSFVPGKRTYVSQRVRLNDVGKANGEMELWADGKSLIKVGGLIIRDKEQGRLRGIQMQTFFGGSNPDWASPKDQDTYFSDFSVAITESL